MVVSGRSSRIAALRSREERGTALVWALLFVILTSGMIVSHSVFLASNRRDVDVRYRHQTLAATIARKLGLTGALGTVAESVDGVFTGRLVGEILHGAGKAHAVRSLAIREGLNLRRCTAYSDSINDVPIAPAERRIIGPRPDVERGVEIPLR